MSLDLVDDLHAAEDLLASVRGALARRLPPFPSPLAPFVSIQEIADQIAGYCRPSCGMHGTPHTSTEDGHHDPDDETCGCLCHSAP